MIAWQRRRGQSRLRRAPERVPLLVENLLASPGIPETISDTVRGRLAGFPAHERAVLEAAAVMGRHLDWEILPAARTVPGGGSPGPGPGG